MMDQAAILRARILIVDDQQEDLRLLEYMLRREGFMSVASTTDAREVIALHRAERYDLIVLDLSMPHLSGFELMEQLKEIEPEGYVPVLAVTAEPGHRLRALKAGAKDFVGKPFEQLEVLTRIRNLIEVRLLYTRSRDDRLRLAHYDSATGLPNRSATTPFFTADMNPCLRQRLELEHALRKAVDRGEFVLHYQPKAEIASGRIIGAEALIRWERPGHGLVAPADFIPLLEETGLIVRVGAWVIATVCRQLALWSKLMPEPPCVAVNVSARQFADGTLEAVVANALLANGIPAGWLELEITESSLMGDVERSVQTLRNLKRRGVRISIDDFGTGYSSLAYLKKFPIDTLKIDRAFVRDVTSSPDDAAIVRAIIAMAHSLKLEVIAEGVETEGQLAFLQRNKCDQIQGYYLSRPLPVVEYQLLAGERRTLALPAAAAAVPVRTLLIVDDEVNVLHSLKRLLHRDGYRILIASSAVQGFELLALHQVQVIICDQRMPEMSGTEFLGKVKELYPDTYRIVLSGYADLDTITEAINRGALYRFYSKPWENDELQGNIREAFREYWQVHGMAAGHGLKAVASV